ncbi:MAG TPA: dipeptidase [Anaerolineales bacterium]|nr:dipeptidase [Anaerolineales bacterium]
MSDVDLAVQYAREHQTDFLDEYKDLLRIPSISTLPEHAQDMRRAAEWITAELERLGFNPVEIMPTAGHPIVYGERLKAGANAPTILLYGHYDVQPVDPLEEWKSPPFEPEVRGDNLYARGASDMKGQLVGFLKALESIIRTSEVKLNLKAMIEGEEEVGSANLEDFIAGHKDLLRCDLSLNADTSILAPDTPALTYALRGLAYYEIRLQGPAGDLHSGTYGGIIENPATVLCRLIGGMHDEEGRVTLPGFYDRVLPLSAAERAELAKLPQTDAWWIEKAKVGSLRSGEPGYTATERATARPTLDVNGLLSGFTSVGSKTVLPARAMAKISMRLVPDQIPDEIAQALRTYLDDNVPETVRWEIEDLSDCYPAMLSLDSDAARAAGAALEEVWGKSPLFKREGGSVPVVGLIKEMIGVPTLMLGFGLPDDNLHAPNEKQNLPTFFRGIETYIRLLDKLGARGQRPGST